MSNDRKTLLLVVAGALSVALNLFLVGDYFGRNPFQAHEAAPPAEGRRAILAKYQSLPAEDRTRFRDAMERAGSGQLAASQREFRMAQLATLDAIRATPYDKGRMLEAFASQRAALDKRQRILHAALAEAMAGLTPAQRAMLVDGLP